MSKQRFQGTDGVRGLAVSSDHPRAQGMDPRLAYLQRGILTDFFAEQYAYAAARWLLDRASERLISPGAIVVAWDPRDTEGRFAGAVMRGVLKAGGHLMAAGVLPTPSAAVYMVGIGAAGALVVTASHNPAEQNGIKIFTAPRGLKPLPEEDDEISALLWQIPWESIAELPESGVYTESSSEARAVYAAYMSRLPNCWLRAGDLGTWDISLDPARGAWSGLAAEVLAELNPRSFAEVNRLGEGNVNEGGGVIALEGRRIVTGDETSVIEGHAGLKRLFESGRATAEALRRGEGFAVCGVFDADGDRTYTIVYEPFSDAALVLGGDEALVLQAGFLQAEEELPEGGTSALTIESDAGAASALADLGLRVAFAPVGDKWILTLASRLEGEFACGGEESGHTVVPGRMTDAYGHSHLLAVGDGFKSFLNTCAAIHRLSTEHSPEETYRMLSAPFPRGFKKTLTVYHVDRTRFAPGTETWDKIKSTLESAARSALPDEAQLRWAPLDDDPAVMYLAIDVGGRPEGAIYIRNSGTERKTSVVLRGPVKWEQALIGAGNEVIRPLLLAMKDEDDPYARAEQALLSNLAEKSAAPEELDERLRRDPVTDFGAEVTPSRVCKEAHRGGLAAQADEKLVLTDLGHWFLENWNER